jgi:hypothetical protein
MNFRTNHISGFVSAFILIILFYFIAHGLMLIDIIDDGVFAINRVFIGFYQWMYVLPLLYYSAQKGSKEFLVGLRKGAIVLSLLNIALILWIFIDPSRFM